jgi:hypothetical protein
MAKNKIKSEDMAPQVIGRDGDTYNPLPTALTDVANSSLTFDCPVPMYLLVTISGWFQTNSTAQGNLKLNVDGTDQTRGLHQHMAGVAGTEAHQTNSRQLRVTLAAGSHTIKLRVNASVINSVVCYEPSWWGLLVAQ